MQRRETRTLAAVLFTDMVDSTAIAEELGDRRWKALVDAHHTIVRRALKRFGGSELDTAGDGFYASFKEPASAIACACAAAEAVRELGVEIRAGIHFGECERIGKKLGGITVVIGARIMALGGPGDVLVSSTAAELSRGAGFGFEDRGVHRLKGVEDEWRVVAATEVDGEPRDHPLAPADARQRRERITPEAPRGRRVVAVAALAALALVASAIVVPRIRGEGETSLPPDSVGAFDGSSGKLLGTVQVGSRPSAVAGTEDAIWVANAASNNVMRIDRSSRSVVDTIPVGRNPEAIVAGADAIWVANTDDRSVTRIDPTGTAQTIAVGGGPLALAATTDAVWVANAIDGTVQRIDALTQDVGEPIRVGGSPSAIAIHGASVLVTNETDGSIITIDAASGTETGSSRVGAGPSDVDVGPDGSWVTNQADGTITYVPLDTSHGPTTTALGIDPSSIAVKGDLRWASSGSDGTLWQLTADGRVARTIDVGASPTDLTIVDDELWVTAEANPRISHRGGTLRVLSEGKNPPQHINIDPARAFEAPSWALLNITNDGLVAERKTGGARGAELVADLATTLPAPSDGGRRYSFQLRPGIRYSDGSTVVASDIRRAIERSVTAGIGDDFFASIVGTDACRAGDRCHLDEGIETTDLTGTVTFHLSRADPDFLYELALPFAAAIPVDTPDLSSRKAQKLTAGLPSTGPYVITEYASGDHVTLERNPYFEEWSSEAQPAGFPDRIEVTMWTNADHMVTEIEHGKADVQMPGDAQTFPTGRVNEVVTRYPAQTHITAERTAQLFALNTRKPPFKDVRVRKALNYAIDRNHLVDLWGGPDVARVTCQTLPPNVPGYQPYCPYTVDPSASGVWKGSDLRTAKRLVADSGTKGLPITVVTFNGFADPGAATGRYLARVLENGLGYHVTFHNFGSDFDASFRMVKDSSNGVDVGAWYWVPDIPVPSNYFVPLLSCDAFVPNSLDNGNAAGFCAPAIDAEMTRASRLLAQDPSAGVALWADIDRKVTDRAPWVPLVTQQRVEIVSSRVGNYQRNPQWGTLLSQLWVQ
jgi:YVTN family beta-propeller protein